MSSVIVWLRRDLRIQDNAALYYAAKVSTNVIPIYIQDDSSVFSLRKVQRVWLHQSLQSLKKGFEKHNIRMIVKKGDTKFILWKLAKQYQVDCIFWNRGCEPQQLRYEESLIQFFQEKGVQVRTFLDHFLVDPHVIQTIEQKPIKVFDAFLKAFNKEEITFPYPVPSLKQNSIVLSDSIDALQVKREEQNNPFLKLQNPGEEGAYLQIKTFVSNQLKGYEIHHDRLDFPVTSRLSSYIHFGEISLRTIWHFLKQTEAVHPELQKDVKKFCNELIWHEFSCYTFFHFPGLREQSLNGLSFSLENNETWFERWKEGQTGYPLVDAAMRELCNTGYLSNRARLIAASFLTKNLRIDWREGARWFEEKLLDADLACNAFNWQWVAGAGFDRQPLFRVPNPVLQSIKFDPNGDYIKKWIPEISMLPHPYIFQPWIASPDVLKEAYLILGEQYPFPLVDHQEVRREWLLFSRKMRHGLY